MNTYRKAKKAKQIWDYYFYKVNPKMIDELRWIKSYERAISFKSERFQYSEDILYALAKLYYYSWFYNKSLSTIDTCLEYSWWFLKGLELKAEILKWIGKEKEADKALKKYEIQLKKSDEIDLETFKGKW